MANYQFFIENKEVKLPKVLVNFVSDFRANGYVSISKLRAERMYFKMVFGGFTKVEILDVESDSYFELFDIFGICETGEM
jgi:hypothetical protein